MFEFLGVNQHIGGYLITSNWSTIQIVSEQSQAQKDTIDNSYSNNVWQWMCYAIVFLLR